MCDASEIRTSAVFQQNRSVEIAVDAEGARAQQGKARRRPLIGEERPDRDDRSVVFGLHLAATNVRKLFGAFWAGQCDLARSDLLVA